MNILLGMLSLFELGEEIGFMYEKGRGRIISILSNNRYLVNDFDGYERICNSAELIKIHHIKLNDSSTIIQSKEFASPNRKKIPENQPDTLPKKDLHIEVLTKNHHRMTSKQILDLQVHHLKLFCAEMMANRKIKFIIIHGVGEGVLRDEVHRFLRCLKGASFSDADFRKFGQGATEVRLSYVRSKV